MYFYFTV